jgi:hypothetical protein
VRPWPTITPTACESEEPTAVKRRPRSSSANQAGRTPLDPTPAGATDQDGPNRRLRRVKLALPRPDSWIVALVRGERVTAPFWAMSLPQAMAITNPVFVTRR